MNQNDPEFGMEREIINAKAYLYSGKNSQGQNLYKLHFIDIYLKITVFSVVIIKFLIYNI